MLYVRLWLFRRWRSRHKIVLVILTIATLPLVYIFMLNTNQDQTLVPAPPTIRHVYRRLNLSLTYIADIFTKDIPDITEYKFVFGNNFSEYEIPVKDERVAYGPNLDPLEVFVIPFSHADPGYGMTFEGYYQWKVKSILDSMTLKLHQYSNLTFQWAETIFLERWWRDISDDVKDQVRALIQNGRLEILSGGWVMPDEAITHYSPVIDQLIEGHQWLLEELGVKPKNNWANDPFGYSSTFPYLWRKSGMENMVILRIHQAIKSTLMKKQALEFIWKPFWDSHSLNNDIFCHVMPYRGYWIGDTCGPYNQHICREYAFMHTNPIHKVVFITDSNLEERARILYEQYRITAELYRRANANVSKYSEPQNLYLPMFLGEDFSYVTGNDFELIYKNYTKLFEYMNSKSEWKIQIKFGTVAEYFSKVKANQNKRHHLDGSRILTLTGDFFPYSDYQNDYWTGFYTTRPFNKQLSRELQSRLKMADIFHTYAYAQSQKEDLLYKEDFEVMSLLQKARRTLGMFLHHDGITGTSLWHVAINFRLNLYIALLNVQRALKLVTSQLLTNGHIPGVEVLKETSSRISMSSIREDIAMNVSSSTEGSLIIVTNPSPRGRTDVISFVVKSESEHLVISTGDDVVDFDKEHIGDMIYRIRAVVYLPPVSIKTYSIKTDRVNSDTHSNFTANQMVDTFDSSTKARSIDRKIVMENTYMFVEIDSETGFPKRIREKNKCNLEIDIDTQILAYKSLRSGAYTFAPNGSARVYLFDKPKIIVRKGLLSSSVRSIFTNFTLITYLYNVSSIKGKGIHITTMFDMSKGKHGDDKEVILRFKTSVNNGNAFYTDQNGFQLVGRKTRVGRLIEENYFPITTMMMIEDSTKKLTLHTAQPHGAACLDNGWMEVMLDRRISRDDGKGLGQGVMDNVLTIANFILHLETRVRERAMPTDLKYSLMSETNILVNELLNEPTDVFFVEEANLFQNQNPKTKLNHEVSMMKMSLPCQLSLAGLRSIVRSDLTYSATSLVLHHTPTFEDFEGSVFCQKIAGSVTLSALFPGLSIKAAEETSLTHLYTFNNINNDDDLRPSDMELRSFKIKF